MGRHSGSFSVWLHRRRPAGRPGLGAPVPGRAARGAAGVRVVLQGAAASGAAADDAAAAAADGGPSRAHPPAAAPPPPHPSAQAAAGDAGRQVLTWALDRDAAAAADSPQEPLASGGTEVTTWHVLFSEELVRGS